MIAGFVRALLALLLLATSGLAVAHTRSESHSTWTIDGASVHMTFTAPAKEVGMIPDIGRPPRPEVFLAYVGAHVGVYAGDVRCGPLLKPKPLTAAPGYFRAEFTYRCPSPKDMRLTSTAFVDLVHTHTDFAQVETSSGDFNEALLTADNPDVSVGSGSGIESARFLDFVRMGIMHIFTGVDHMSFLVGLVLISRRLRDLVFVVTGFTIGHSLTLALAVTGIIRPHAEFIDALVALTIALIGIENVAVQTRRPGTLALATGLVLLAMTGLRLIGIGTLPPLLLLGVGLFASNYLMVSGHLRDAGRLRLVVTLVFGLIHGFGFAADLLETRLPKERLAELLVGFNLGVEIGQLTLVIALTAIVMLLVRLKLALPRPIVVDVAAAVLIGLGTYWFIGRSFAVA